MSKNRALFIIVVAGLVSVGIAGIAAAVGPVRLFLEDGTVIGGNVINPTSPEFTAEPGAYLAGTIAFRCENDDPAQAEVEGALSWESDHARSYAVFGSFGQGVNHSSMNVERLKCPSVAGTYYMILGSFAAADTGYVASLTSPTCGTRSWNDGNDLADQNATTLAGALTDGWVNLNVWMCDSNQSQPVGATYITVNILDHPTGACCVGQDPNWECVIASETACSDAGGSFNGVGSVCDPSPCVVPVQSTTWGKVRGLFR